MKRRFLIVLMFLAFLIMILPLPVERNENRVVTKHEVGPFGFLMPAADITDYVDINTSDVDSSPDKGTHSSFANMQAYDSVYDTLTEEYTGVAGTNHEDFVDQQSNLHPPSDIGTHSSFAAMENRNGTYNTLTESDTGDAGHPESWYTPSSHLDPSSDWSDETNAYDDNTGTRATCAVSNTGGYYGYLELYLSASVTSSKLRYWIGYGSRFDGFQVDVYDGISWTNVLDTATPTADAWANATFTQQIVEGVRFRFSKSNGQGDPFYVYEADILEDAAPSSPNYRLDLEIGWTDAPYSEENKYLCVYGGTQASESLSVEVWSGSEWTNVIIDVHEGWNNVSVSSYLVGSSFEIRFVDTIQSSDATQSAWQIDAVLLHCWTEAVDNYELDLEVQWTSATYEETNEYLCIYMGSTDAENLGVDVRYGSAWHTLTSRLNAHAWNNISVSSYLDSSIFTIRFKGQNETGDTVESAWEVDAVLLHTWTPPNNVPQSDRAPTCSNLDDSHFYARYKAYQITVYVSDLDGFADIDYLELTMASNDRATEYWIVRYDEDSGVFTEQSDPNDYIELNTSSSVAAKSSNTINATFQIVFNWAHPNIADCDIRVYVVDNESDFSTEWYEANWNVETRLDFSIAPAASDGDGTDNRGNLNDAFIVSGTIIYYGSTDIHPLPTEVDVWVSASEYGTNVGPWSDLTPTSGAFDVTCYADDTVGQDTYMVKVVADGTGPGGTDLYYTTSASTTYVADQLVISITDPLDQRINIGENATGIIVSAVYAHDGSVFDGILTLNDTTFDYGTLGRRGYTASVASGGVHGVSLIGVNDVTYCIWDSLTISILDSSDQRISINTNASGIIVTALYDYDSSPFDGTLTLNNTQFQYGTAQIQYYTVQSVSGGLHGITAISSNDVTWCIWDSLSITITDPPDQRININLNATGVFITAVYDYDDSPFDGTLTLNNTLFSYSTAQIQWYTVESVSGGAHSVTAISSNDVTWCIWDSLTITITNPSDQRININTNASGIVVTAVYDYDSTTFDGTLTLNNTQFAYGTAQIQWYSVSTVSGGAYGISAVSVNDVRYCIWDSLTVIITDPSDIRININTNATGIVASAVYDYDSSVFDGGLTLNNTQFIYATAQVQWYTIQSASGGTYGISAISSNDLTYCIWDSLTVTITDPMNQRININGNASGIVASAVYDYDGAIFDGTLSLNNTQFSYPNAQIQWYTVDSVSGGTFEITAISVNDLTYCIWDSLSITVTDPSDQRINIDVNASGIVVTAVYDYDSAPFDGMLALNNTQFSYGTAQIQYYTVQSVNGGLYDITTISSNDVTYCIWDSLTVSITGPSDQRININTNASGIIVTAVYDYDGSPFDGSLTLNNTQFQYGTVQIQYYTVESVSGGLNGITAILTNDLTYCIWDSLTISITDPSDQRININSNATGIFISAVYDYDGSVFDGTLILNNTQYVYPTSQIQWYTVDSVSGGTHAITAISANDLTYSIWDSLTIAIIDPLDQRMNINTNASGIVVSAVYDYDGFGFDGTLTLNNTQFSYSTAQIQWYTVESVSGGAYGITAILANDLTYCIWDSLTISITDPSDQRININANASGMVVSAIYDYDGSTFDGTLNLNNTQFIYSTAQIQWYAVDSVSGGTHGITAISRNDATYCIWDQLVVTIGVDDFTPVNGVQANFSLTVIFDFDHTACAMYQLVIQRNGTWWQSFTDANKSLFVDTNSDTRYTYTVRLATSESTYNILVFSTNSVQVVWSAALNNAPMNDAAPVLTNADDATYMYARYKYYVLTSNVSDLDGYADIEYVELTLYDDLRTTAIWTVRYTVAGGTFSIQLGSAYIVIGASSSDSMSGNELEITWFIKIDWDHPILTNVDIKQHVYDGADGVEDFYESNWDIETRLEIVGLTIEDGSGTSNRGPLDGSYNVSGTLIYLGSEDNYPLSNETDVWVSAEEYGTNLGPWSDFALVSGQFSLTAYADDEVGIDLLTIKIVRESAGIGGANLLESVTQFSYITDRIQVQVYISVDSRINIGDIASIQVELWYEYDSSYVTEGTVTVNGISATHQGNGIWQFTDSKASVQLLTYDTVVYSGGTHGLTQVNQNAMSQDVIWDQIQVQFSSVSDNHVSVGDTVDLDVTLISLYDSSSITDGSVTINGVVASHQGGGTWRISVTNGSVSSIVFDSVTCSGNLYGITAVDLNSFSQTVIWDRLMVAIGVDEASLMNGVQANFSIVVTFEYDGSVCNTYQVVVTRNTTWWHSFTNTNQSLFVDVGVDVAYEYTVSLVSAESTFGVTMFTTNTIVAVWSTEPNEVPRNLVAPVLINPDGDSMYARYRYYMITTNVSDADGCLDISYVELSLFASDNVSLIWTIRFTRATGVFSVEVGNTYVTISTSSHPIGSGDALEVVWFLKIEWYHPDVRNCYVEQFVTDGIDSDVGSYLLGWNVETRLDYTVMPYLSHDRGDVNTTDLVAQGSVVYYDSSISPRANETDVWVIHDVGGEWMVDLSSGAFTIGSISSSLSVRLNTYTFKIVVEGNGSGGADLYYTTSVTDTFITDRVEIYQAGAVDERINVDTDCEVWWSIRYAYDGLDITSGLIVQISGFRTLLWDPVEARWFWAGTESSVHNVTFDIISVVESTYGLTNYSVLTAPQSVIWDGIIIFLTDPVDQRTDVGANATGITVSAVYAFDGAPFDGTIELNNTSFVYSSPQKQGYSVLSVSGGAHGISIIVVDDTTWAIWDRVHVVSMTADFVYFDPDESASVFLTLHYEYDDTLVTAGTFGIAGEPMTHVGSGLWETSFSSSMYESLILDDLSACNATLYGITEYNMDGNRITLYWDRLEFYAVAVTDARINVGDSVTFNWSVRLEHAGVSVFSGVAARMTGGLDLLPTDGFLITSHSQSSVGSATFGILSASLENIDNFVQSADDVNIVWDRVRVETTTASAASLNIGESVEIRVTLVYEFDEASMTDGSVRLTDGSMVYDMSYNAGGYWSASISKTTAGSFTFRVDSVNNNEFGINAIDLNGRSAAVEFIRGISEGLPIQTIALTATVGVVAIGAAVFALRRRGPGDGDIVGLDIEPEDLGVAEPVTLSETDTAKMDSMEDVEEVLAEIEAEAAPEEISEGPSIDEVSESETVPEPEEATSVAPELEETELEEITPTEEDAPADLEVSPEEVVTQPDDAMSTGTLPEPDLELESPEVPPVASESEAPEENILPAVEPEVEADGDFEVEPDVAEVVVEVEPVPERTPTKKELLDSMAPEVRDAIPEADLQKLSKKEIKSLIESYEPPEEPLPDVGELLVSPEPTVPAPSDIPLSELSKKELMELLPEDIKSTVSGRELKRLSKQELISLLESFIGPDRES